MDCTCFSLCTHAEAAAFVSAIPHGEAPEGSPWHGYLRVVYGPAPPPRRLSDINFWYHHHARWPAAVEWPMARCVSSRRGAAVWFRDPTTPMCEPVTCRRWLDDEYTYDPSQSRFQAYAAWAEAARAGAPFYNASVEATHAVCSLSPRNNYSCVRALVVRAAVGTSRATLLSEKLQQGAVRTRFYKEAAALQPGAPLVGCVAAQALRSKAEARLISASMSLLGRGQPCGHDEWIEVFREDDRGLVSGGAQLEGHGEYGCWFFPARGSGVFLNAGRTRLLYRKSDVADLSAEWQGGVASAGGRIEGKGGSHEGKGGPSTSKWGSPALQSPRAPLAHDVTSPRHDAAEVWARDDFYTCSNREACTPPLQSIYRAESYPRL